MSAVICNYVIERAQILIESLKQRNFVIGCLGEVLGKPAAAVFFHGHETCQNDRTGIPIKPQSFYIENAESHILEVAVKKARIKIFKAVTVFNYFHKVLLLPRKTK